MGNNGFGYPFIVVISQEEAKSRDRIYEAIVDRLSRWTDVAHELYSYEAGEEVAQIPINLNAGQPVNTITEIKENGEVVTVPDLEGDIVDQKGVVMDDLETAAASEPVLAVPRRVGVKKLVFELGISPGHSDYGAGAQLRAFQTASWEDRLNDNDKPLLKPDDALVCSFDANIQNYFFGSPSTFERARWDKWQRFLHPEYEASVAATASKKKSSISLQECLDEFTREEELGEDDLWYCPRCKKHQQAKKRFDLWKTPDVLVVHLKRFSNTRSMRDKIDTLVDFPTEGLDLSNMIGERKIRSELVETGVDVEALGMGSEDESAIYDLYGVDEHLGGLGGGHYRAYAYNHETKKWYHFDDSYVTESSASDSVVSAGTLADVI
jgi:ubiquitin carboxyl-terminal hydrolase 4/11/15